MKVYTWKKKEGWNLRSITVQIYKKMGKDSNLWVHLCFLLIMTAVSLSDSSPNKVLSVQSTTSFGQVLRRETMARVVRKLSHRLCTRRRTRGDHVARFACPRQALDRRPAMTSPGDDGSSSCQRPSILHTNNRGYVAIDCPPRSPKRAT